MSEKSAHARAIILVKQVDRRTQLDDVIELQGLVDEYPNILDKIPLSDLVKYMLEIPPKGRDNE